MLTLYINVISGVNVYPKVIEKHWNEEMPFFATENILMYCVKKGGDRQALHEAIREHSVAAGYAIKHDGASNDLLDRIANDPRFNLTRQELDELLANSCFTGMAVEQTESYVAEVRKVLAENKEFLAEKIEAKVNV
jgi:adenylosuccinate lyase